MIRSLIVTFRPWHWVKNLFVVAPMVFSAQALTVPLALRFAAGFGVFCLLSSLVYGLNDLADAKKDRLHPLKKHRPIASGRLRPKAAWASVITLAAVTMPPMWMLGREFFLCGAAYLALNLAYSFGLKNATVVDAICIALGFVIRVWAGTALANVEPTAWILMSTFFLALFLAFTKRRQEIAYLIRARNDAFAAPMGHTVQFFDNAIMVVSSCTIMCYALFCMSEYAMQKFHTHYVIATVPFVVFGMLRYFHLVYNRNRGEDPTRALLTDIPLQLCVALWFGAFVAIIYFF
jgi:4-hydroxybenzoate polyprenyltransferase